MTAGAVGVAVALDAAWREPPLAVHPVRGIGRLLDALAPRVPAAPPRRAATRGAVAWCLGLAAVTGAAAVLDRAADRSPAILATLARGTALWPLLSLRMLCDEVAAVEGALARDLPAGRAAVGRIVSRDVRDADEVQVRTAAIASLAENVSDAFVAPLVWFLVGGLPAAAAYRFANTADAMWGYRDARWRDAGRVAARADDVVNLLPARLTGLVLALGGVRLADLRREARRTPSPNGGWPMAAVALQLGTRCDKPGAYVLHAVGRPARAEDTAAALRLVRRRALLLAAALVLVDHVRRPTCRR